MAANADAENYFSRISPYYVVDVGAKVKVQNLSNEQWFVPKDVLVQECYGTKARHTVRMPITKLVQQVFLNTKEKIFEVTFKKKNGDERVLVGFRQPGSTEGNILGQSEVWELVYEEGKLKKQMRTVNHRTITKLKFCNTEYVVHRSSTADTIHPPSMVQSDQLAKGDMIMRVSYMRSIRRNSDETTEVENLVGKRWSIGNKILEDDCYSTKATKAPEPLRMTKLAQVLTDSGDTVIKTTFLKKDGTSRVMVGHHYFNETCLGRSKVKELVVKDGRLVEQERQIDHQTIQEIVFKGDKFVLGVPKKRKAGSP